MYAEMKSRTAVLIRSSVATVVVVAGRVVASSVVVGIEVAGGGEVVGAGVVSAVVGAGVPPIVGGAAALLLLHDANASAARPKQARRFIVCTQSLQSASATLTLGTTLSSRDPFITHKDAR